MTKYYAINTLSLDKEILHEILGSEQDQWNEFLCNDF